MQLEKSKKYQVVQKNALNKIVNCKNPEFSIFIIRVI